MSEELLNIAKELSEKPTTELALQFMELTADNITKDKEIDRLNNIINELEKILLEKIDAIKTIKITLGEDGANAVTPNINLFEKEYRYFLNKLKELKENK